MIKLKLLAKKKYFRIFIIFLLLGILYLYLLHELIYYRLQIASLKTFDMYKTFILNSNASTSKSIVYASLGDSLTSGAGADNYEESYPYLLAQKFSAQKGNISLKSFSYPGARTDDLIKDLLTPAIAQKPDIVTLLIGTNDIHGNVSESTFRKNYQFILERLTRETSAKVYVINIPFIGSDTLLLPPYKFYYSNKAERFNKIIKELATNFKVDYIDLATPTAELLKQDGSHYSRDAFHPSASGYALWAKIIYDNINQ